MEGKPKDVDFNFYSQLGALKYNIHAIYKNSDSIHVNIEAEGTEVNLNNYVEYLKEGPLKKYIYLFRTEKGEFRGLYGFESKKVHKDDLIFLQRLKKLLGIV